jgi:hypothetical protein
LSHDDQVVPIFGQPLKDLCPIDDQQARTYSRISAHEGSEQMGHKVFRGGDSGHVQRSLDPTLEGENKAAQGIDLATNELNLACHGFPYAGEVDLFADALDERQTNGLLEAFHRDGNGRLSQMHGFGRLGEAFVVSNRLKHAQLLQRKIHF